MIVKIFTIYDSKAEVYLQPFCMKSKGEAIRSVSECVNDPKHNFCKYAEDFTLFEVGTFDDSNCSVVTLCTPMSMGVLIEFKKDGISHPTLS